MQFASDSSDSTDVLVEVLNGLYSAIEQKLEVLEIAKPYVIFSCRWFTVYGMHKDDLESHRWVVFKWNHLFQSLEPDVLARLYHYYPVNFDIYKADIHARGVFVGGKA